MRDVAAANVQAGLSRGACGAFNIGSGTRITINELARVMQGIAAVRGEPRYAPPRMGDVRDSLADIRAAHAAFGFAPRTPMAEGLAEYWGWFSRDELTLKRLGFAT